MIGNSAAATLGVLWTAIVSLAAIPVAGFFEKDIRSMSLVELSYHDGMITQIHNVSGGPIIGTWAAEIVRGNQQLCSGGSKAPYQGGKKSFNPSDWTGDSCPELQAGDKAIAVWQYTLEGGTTASISGELVIN